MNQLDLLTTLNYTDIAMTNNNTPAFSRVSGIIPTKVLLDEFGLDDISTRKRIYIVAGTYSQFKNYVITKVNTHDNSSEFPRYIYVHTADVLRGLSSLEGFFVGTWRERKDISEIKLAIKIIKRG
jgi:hypothetical protein